MMMMIIYCLLGTKIGLCYMTHVDPLTLYTSYFRLHRLRF